MQWAGTGNQTALEKEKEIHVAACGPAGGGQHISGQPVKQSGIKMTAREGKKLNSYYQRGEHVSLPAMACAAGCKPAAACRPRTPAAPAPRPPARRALAALAWLPHEATEA